MEKVQFRRTGSRAAIKLPDQVYENGIIPGRTVSALKQKDNGEGLFVGDKVTLYDYDGNPTGDFEIVEAIPVEPRKQSNSTPRLSHEAGGGSGQGFSRTVGGGCVLSNGKTVKLRYLLGKAS